MTKPKKSEPWSLPYDFGDEGLLRDALTHPSAAAHEVPAPGELRQSARYQRLEFLGDRVLGLEVAHYLFDFFPCEAEGDLSRRLHNLVSQRSLARVARRFELDKHLVHALSETVASDAVLSDCLEAVIGAAYIDGGYAAARKFVRALMREELENPPPVPPLDPKTRLQEWGLRHRHGLPQYRVMGHEGPGHAPSFLVSVFFPGTDLPSAEGTGSSHRHAERAAATALLSLIPDVDDDDS